MTSDYSSSISASIIGHAVDESEGDFIDEETKTSSTAISSNFIPSFSIPPTR